MTSFPRSTWIPSTSSDPASSFPFSLQVRFTRGGSTTQPRLTGPPSFWTMEAGCTVTCRDSPAQREKMGIRKLCETQQQKRQKKAAVLCILHSPLPLLVLHLPLDSSHTHPNVWRCTSAPFLLDTAGENCPTPNASPPLEEALNLDLWSRLLREQQREKTTSYLKHCYAKQHQGKPKWVRTDTHSVWQNSWQLQARGKGWGTWASFFHVSLPSHAV